MRGLSTLRALVVFGVLTFAVMPAEAQPRIEKNVVYGMYSGLALLMDVHRPDAPNGYGVILIAGSGWHSPLGYGAGGLKETRFSLWGEPLVKAGFTVFAINHRAAPRFHYPAALEDVQRAVRFVRHHAQQYGIDPNRIGGVGGSSGAHLIGLVAMIGAAGDASDSDPVNRQTATLQAIVMRAGPSDLLGVKSPLAVATVTSFLERLPLDQKIYRTASPITYVSKTSPPTLLVHGDADDTIPFEQSVAFERALAGAGVPVKLVRVEGGAHGDDFGTAGKPHPQFPGVRQEVVAWLMRHLPARKADRGAPDNGQRTADSGPRAATRSPVRPRR